MGAHTQLLNEIAPGLEKLAGTDMRKLCLRPSRRGGESGTSYSVWEAGVGGGGGVPSEGVQPDWDFDLLTCGP